MRVSGAGLILLAAVWSACKETTRPDETAVPINATPLDGKGVTPVSLSVVISNTDGLGNPYGIQNDGQGPYVDGVQNVGAGIDQYGDFAFNTFTANRGAATRWANYDFSRPVDPSNTYRPGQDHTQNYHFSTGASAYSAWVPLQNLGVSGNPSSECGYMGNGFAANSKTTYRVSFHKGEEDTQSSSTAFAVFTRTSVTPAIWTVTPVGSCSPNSNVASLRSGDGSVLYGYYTIPFFMTLTAR